MSDALIKLRHQDGRSNIDNNVILLTESGFTLLPYKGDIDVAKPKFARIKQRMTQDYFREGVLLYSVPIG